MDSDEETEIFSYAPLKRIKIGDACSSLSLTYSAAQKASRNQKCVLPCSQVTTKSALKFANRNEISQISPHPCSLKSTSKNISSKDLRTPDICTINLRNSTIRSDSKQVNCVRTSKLHKSSESFNIISKKRLFSQDNYEENYTKKSVNNVDNLKMIENNESSQKMTKANNKEKRNKEMKDEKERNWNKSSYIIFDDETSQKKESIPVKNKKFSEIKKDNSLLSSVNGLSNNKNHDLAANLVSNNSVVENSVSLPSYERFELAESSLKNVNTVSNTPVITIIDSSENNSTTQNNEQRQNDDNNVMNEEIESDDLEDFTIEVDSNVVRKNSENKVNKWLESSFAHITPDDVQIQISEDNMNTAKYDAKTGLTINEELSGEIHPKQCIHLHFQATPNKLKQSTLESFFKQSPTNSNSPKANVCSIQSKCQVTKSASNKGFSIGVNEMEVIRTWESIMKVFRKDAHSNSHHTGQNNSEKSASNFFEKKRKFCPSYKFIKGTPFVVDAFAYGYINGVSAYFLSHFHYDHYVGLTKHFRKHIYCSQITANLVLLKLKVEKSLLRVVPMEEPRVIDGIEVTLFDANHCPGAVMFLFKLRNGQTILHVGDFRFDPSMESIGAFWNHSVNLLYLDTTYLDPRYDFISQDASLEKCVAIVRKHATNSRKPLFVVGSYTVGKEKVFKTIARELDSKIYAVSYKRMILDSLEDDELTERLTGNKFDACVHVVPMSQLSHCKLRKYLDSMKFTFKSLIAIKATGWQHSEKLHENDELPEAHQNGSIYSYGIPYSEHSSFHELKRCLQFLRPDTVIPTVTSEQSKRISNYAQKWIEEARSIL